MPADCSLPPPYFSLLLFPCPPVLAACGVQAFIFQHQAFNRPAADNVFLHDLIHVGQRNTAVPDCLWIDHQIRPMLALVEASRLIGAHSAFQPTLGKFHFEQLLQLGLSRGIATSARMPWRTLVPANENMALEFRHSNIVQERQAAPPGVILISTR